MKAILILASTLLTITAFAAQANANVTANSSWSDILSSEQVQVEMPTIRLTHGSITTIDQLCIDKNSFRTKTKFTKYINTRKSSPRNDDRRPRYKAVKYWGLANFIQTYTVCENDYTDRIGQDRHQIGCDREYVKSYRVPFEYTGDNAISVYNVRNLDRDNERVGRLLFKKPYSIPQCN